MRIKTIKYIDPIWRIKMNRPDELSFDALTFDALTFDDWDEQNNERAKRTTDFESLVSRRLFLGGAAGLSASAFLPGAGALIPARAEAVTRQREPQSCRLQMGSVCFGSHRYQNR
jgi:hypothetical protein